MPRERNEPAGIERALKAAMQLTPTDLGKVVRHLAGKPVPPKSLQLMAYVEQTYAELSEDGRAYLTKKLTALHEIVQPKPAAAPSTAPATPQPAAAPETGSDPQ